MRACHPQAVGKHEMALSVNITSRCHDTKMTHPAHRHICGDGDELGMSPLTLEMGTEIPF